MKEYSRQTDNDFSNWRSKIKYFRRIKLFGKQDLFFVVCLSFEHYQKNRLKILQRLYTGMWEIQPILFCLVIDKIGGNL